MDLMGGFLICTVLSHLTIYLAAAFDKGKIDQNSRMITTRQLHGIYSANRSVTLTLRTVSICFYAGTRNSARSTRETEAACRPSVLKAVETP